MLLLGFVGVASPISRCCCHLCVESHQRLYTEALRRGSLHHLRHLAVQGTVEGALLDGLGQHAV